VGEICVFGPQVMRGYWNRPDETEKVMFGDWLRTGDIGAWMTQGFVYIEDRKKDMILVSGFNVYPNEIESVAAAHPGVLEVAPRSRSPTRIPARWSRYSWSRRIRTSPPSALIAFCRTELTGYKVPKHVYFRNELPKTNVGKILRRALRDELRAARAGGRSFDRANAVNFGTECRTVSHEHRATRSGIDVGRDAVAQIEHMPGARPIALEHAQGFGAQRLRRREQRGRIEIALQRDAAADACRAVASSPWSNRRRRHRSRWRRFSAARRRRPW
jgi:hypothetical protein